jgi:iron complex transport system substrate-binding protein
VSLDPSTLADVLDGIRRVGSALGHPERAAAVHASLQQRVDAVRAAVARLPRPRVMALEWADPPFNAGHWVPEMIEAAGGEPVLARYGTPSVRIEWADIETAAPDVVVFMPCGYPMATAQEEGRRVVLPRPELRRVPTIVAAYGDAFFSRPGPRVVDGIELLAGVLHPHAWSAAPAEGAVVLRPADGDAGTSC